jgi:hypothetical protein
MHLGDYQGSFNGLSFSSGCKVVSWGCVEKKIIADATHAAIQSSCQQTT